MAAPRSFDSRASRSPDLPARNGGPVPEFDPTPWVEKRIARRMGRFSQLALVASLLALEDAGLADVAGERTGVTIHTGAGGLLEGDEEVLARQEAPGAHRAALRAARQRQHGGRQHRDPARRHRARDRGRRAPARPARSR